MKRFYMFLLSIVVSSVLFAQTATHVMISEVSPMKGTASVYDTGEFIELYNPLPTDVVFGANVQIVSGNTSGTNAAEWQVSLSGKTIKAYGFLLIGDGAVAGRDVNFPASKNLANSATRSCVQLREGTTVIDAFGWDPNTAPLLAPEGNRFSPTSTTSDGKSFERKSSSTATAPDTLGNAWDTNNNATDFFQNGTLAANPQNSSSPIEKHPFTLSGGGSGNASVFPSSVKKSSTTNFKIYFLASDIDSLLLIVPGEFTWSKSASDVQLVQEGVPPGSKAVSGDTIFVGKIAQSQFDTLTIVINNVVAPDSVGSFIFKVLTAHNGGAASPISTQPVVTTYRITPIVEIHIHNSQGVPVAPYQVGATVTVTGVITADLTPTRTDVYVQDETGGINLFRPTRSFNYQVGDSITVTGSILQFRGLTEISPDTTTYVVHAKGRPVPEPFLVTAAEVNATFNTDDYTEPNESRLVRINNVTYNASTSTITDATGTTGTYIPVPPFTAPAGTFDLIGILKQFKPGTPAPGPPYTGDYEVVPRMQADIILYPGPIITVPPHETNIKSNEVTIEWKTSTASSGIVKYGTTPTFTDSVVVSDLTTDYAVKLTNLQPSTIYHYQVGSKDGSGMTYTAKYFLLTSSTSNGTINVYFSKSINPTVAQGETAKVTNLSTVLINLINAAQHSIDFCTYSLSGTVGANIATAMLNARNRGVKIRVIGEKDNQGTAPWTTLKNGGVTVIDDGYDLTNAGNGLMHNKFFVFDYRNKSSTADDWVVMGSWNATDPGTNDDAQNVLEIQDQSLAYAYTLEFEEMWGSNGDSPNQSVSRFGARKLDNTPHRFNIGGVPMELYFSPSDRVTSKINSTLSLAASAINVAVLSFTRDELGQTLIAKKVAGRKVRVLMDNNTDSGNEFDILKTAGVDVLLKGSALSGFLHHKYAIVDAENPSVNNYVVTGSHNWSSAAENTNNENTLIINSKRIANLFLQEFKARYIEAGGKDSIILSVKKTDDNIPASFALFQNYPNPFNPSTTIQFHIANRELVSLTVFDILGREVSTLVNEHLAPGVYTIKWNAAQLSSGVYFYRLQAGNFVQTKKLLLQK